MNWKEELVYTVLDRDPAPRSFMEAFMFSPGLHAILLQRVSHRMYLRGDFKMARAINYFSRVLTGADIHPGAKLGKGVFIDHATGVVVGETAEVGKNIHLPRGDPRRCFDVQREEASNDRQQCHNRSPCRGPW